MSLNIKNEKATQLIRELAALEGVSLVAAVTQAVEEKLANERSRRSRSARKARSRYDLLMEFANECSRRIKHPIHSRDIDSYLYGEDGLPK